MMNKTFKIGKALAKAIVAVLLILSSVFATTTFADESNIDKNHVISDFEEVSNMEDEYLYFASQRNINLSQNAKGIVIDTQNDIIKDSKSVESMKTNVDEIIAKIGEYAFNTIYFTTVCSDGSSVLKIEGVPQYEKAVFADFDIVSYTIEKAKESNIYVVMIADVLSIYHDGVRANPDFINNTVIDISAKKLASIAESYKPDGIILDNFYNPSNKFSYGNYAKNGNGIGIDSFMQEASLSLISAVSYSIKSTDYSIAIGLMCDSVWANSTQDQLGSATSAAFTLRYNANLPIQTIINDGYIDFCTIKATTSTADENIPYEEIAKWWDKQFADSGTLCYMLHYNEKIASDEDGFKSPDQIIKQIIASKGYSNYNGSIFNSYDALLDNAQKSTDILIKYLKEEIVGDLILKDLYMTRPKKTVYTTYENSVSFTGTSDPNFDLMINDNLIEVAKGTGNFQNDFELNTGINTFKFSHKSTEITYTITKKTRVLKSISPVNTVVGDGGMKIAIAANAYKDATVWAIVNGTRVNMAMRDDVNESERESIYRDYYGYYTLPESSDKDKYIGKIVVYATYQGNKEQMIGASIKINKKIEETITPDVSFGEGDIYEPGTSGGANDEIPEFNRVHPPASTLVRIKAQETETFPTTILDDDSVPTNYPYPKGAYDYTNGDVLTYSWNGKTYQYYNLKSNRRVYTKDVEVINDNQLLAEIANNYSTRIVVAQNGKNTEIVFSNKYKTPPIISLTDLSFKNDYTISSFNPQNMVVDMPYINAINGIEFAENSVFSSASVSSIVDKGVFKTRIVFKFKNGKNFSGASTFYNSDGKLVISVRNKMNQDLSGVRIVLSQGHGGEDCGAEGFNGINEVQLNKKMTSKIAYYLEQAGAEVVVMPSNIGDSSSGLIQKMADARGKNPDLFLCIHHNSALASSNATGVETYYFAPFTQPLAKNINNSLANYYKNTMYANGSNKYNRGDKFSWRYMTRSMTFPAVLIEYGFINNAKEFDKLVQENHQDGLAKATVEGIRNYLNGQ